MGKTTSIFHNCKLVLKLSLFSFFLFLNLSLFSQTEYQFMSSGVTDSGGSGFKTTTTSPTEANLIISNNIDQGFSANVLFPDKTITTPTDAASFIIKGDGINTDFFNFIDINIFSYSGSPKTVEFESGTQIVFKNTQGNIITTWNTLAITNLTANTNYSIKNIFGQTSEVNNVAEIILTVDYKLNDNITDFEVRTLTLGNLTTLSSEPFSLENDFQFKAHPNPTSNLVYFSKPIKNVSIMNITGQTVLTESNSTNVINMSSLEPGVYFFNIKINNDNFIKRIVKI
ncbi:MAG: T9SS type A sorting domain-containing protein [Algibacter sp.]